MHARLIIKYVGCLIIEDCFFVHYASCSLNVLHQNKFFRRQHFSVERMNEIKSKLKIKGKLLLPRPRFTLNRFQPCCSSQGFLSGCHTISQSISTSVDRFYPYICDFFFVEYYSDTTKITSITISKLSKNSCKNIIFSATWKGLTVWLQI